jgi:acyl-coenzyme A thioesterase PaaI-like protein
MDSDAHTPPVDAADALDPWHARPTDPNLGGDEFGPLLVAMRLLQDRFVSALVPGSETGELIEQMNAVATRLAAHHVAPHESPTGFRNDLPGRGNLLLPPFIIDQMTADAFRGRVTLTQFQVGGNGAAHGGTLPLMFDDILGRMVNGGDRPVARTAYLNVNYRAVTLIGVEHRIEAECTRIEGRKRFAVGRLLAGDVVTADIDALFVELRPGQP